jgi:aminopeptidase-like protein
VRPEYLADSLSIYTDVIEVMERNAIYMNLCPKCEPQLGKRGIYRALGGLSDAGDVEMAMLWVLNLSDGKHSLLDIAEQSDVAFREIHYAAKSLIAHGLLKEA